MEIIVCAKQVPDLTEADIKINPDGKSINLESIPRDINELDNYALEEALLMKEKYSGKVAVVTVGSETSDEMLRICLAKGADEAVRITYKDELDGYLTAKLIAAVIKNKYKPDLILTGVQSSDYSSAQVGGMLAELLDIPHATIVTHAELKNNTKISNMDFKREISTENLSVAEFTAEVHRELEGGLKEIVDIALPAVLTIQSGINEPRYASMIGIRRAKDKEIKILTPEDLGLRLDELKLKTWIKNMSIPPKGEGAEIITGTVEESATKLAGILKDKGALT